MFKKLLLNRVKIFSLSLLGLSFLAAGCATMPKLEKPIERNRTFDAPYEEVWKASINALTSSNQMMTLTEKDSGVIGVDRDFSKEEIWNYALVDSWKKFWTTWIAFHAKANFVIQATDPTRTKVTVNTQIRGGEKNIDYNIWWGYATASTKENLLTSNGKLEKEYLDMIEAQIPALRKIAWIDEKSNTASLEVDRSKPASVKPATVPTTAVVPAVVAEVANPTIRSASPPEAEPAVAAEPTDTRRKTRRLVVQEQRERRERSNSNRE